MTLDGSGRQLRPLQQLGLQLGRAPRFVLELVLIAQDLFAWAKALVLDGELALAEPKRLRHRLLHVAARLVRTGRRLILRLPRSWPWAEALVAAFRRLRELPLGAPG